MTNIIELNESDVRQMPPELRAQLLKWYFDRPLSSALDTAPAPIAPPTWVSAVPKREGSERVSFPEFVRAGLLTPGEVIMCRTLKRQRRAGSQRASEAGKVLADGTVEYKGRRYEVVSKLAVEVVNSSGGKTEALNGYDYLFVRRSNRDVQLKDLRDQFLRR